MNINRPNFEYDNYTGDYGTLKNLDALYTAVSSVINLIDASNNVSLSIAYMDGSLAIRDTAINLRATNASVNGSFATNASVNTAISSNFYSNASLGLTFSRFSNASLGLAFSQYTNVSLGLAFSQYSNASLGNNIRYRADLGVGLRNASGNLYDFVKVDTSAYLKVGATSWAQWKIETTSLG